jgi:hypothetical protein
MKRPLFAALVPFLAVIASFAQVTTEKLPVRRVVLYKNGVGYFEHTGRIRGDQDVKIEFTSSQLNDVLKSLTVLDLNGGKITGVGYNSVAPIAEQLKSLRLPLAQSTNLAGFLTALRGSRIQVRNAATLVSGRLLSVEEETTKKAQEEIKSLQLSVITDAGEVRAFPLTSGLGVRVEDHDLQEEISRYLALVGSSRDQDLRRMSISTSGAGERNIFVSYISEVPVWKSTYRILLPTNFDSKPLLQGWAIVDNTVGEDWKDVQLSLVAGAPQSFIEELSKPYYTRRPVVELPETAMLTPQTHEGTMADASPSAPAPSVSESMGVVGGVAGGSSGGVLGGIVAAKPMKANADMEERVEVTNVAERVEPEASGQSLGDLFEYKLNEKITILKNHSALVPIINAHIEAEKVTLWNGSSEQPLRALWLTNNSGLTLDNGTFNVIENNAFAGEGLIDALKAGERRLLSYAVDQAIRVAQQDQVESRPTTHIKIAHGAMVRTSEHADHRTYTVRNNDSEPRDVIIEHPLRQGWKLAKDLKPEETSASFYRFRIKVAPQQTATLKIDESQPIESRVALASVTDEQIKLFFAQQTINSELDQALRRIIRQKGEIVGFDHQIKGLETQVGAINQDQQRLRENMKALKGSPEEKALLQRYTHELNDQEDKLQSVRAEMTKIESQRAASQQQLDRMMQDLTLDQAI